MQKTLLILVLIFSGCQRPELPIRPQESSNNFVLTQSLSEIKEEFNKIPKKDQDFIYMQFAGSAEFLKHSKTVRSSSNYLQILGKVQSDFGWDVDKYPDFTTSVSNYLLEQGFDNPRMLDSEEDRQWLINIFDNLTNAVK